MITAENEEVFRIFDLVSEQETDRLKRLFPSVYIVSQEEVICFRRKSAVFKQSQEIVVLTVYVT